jgi:catechol 2,3-dioxygenase-like lactoylglutathione lyase family enzyme
MLNVADPDAAIAFFVKAFPATSKTVWEGYPALSSPNTVLILFNKVSTPPDSNSQTTAFWHFGWNVVDERKKVEFLNAQPGINFAPLYTGDGDASVQISSDTLPGAGGVYGQGETQAQMAEAKTNGVKPRGGAGFAYLRGPASMLIEVLGNGPVERFNHVHMWQDDPYCAQLWYEKHLNATPPKARPNATATPYTEANCKVPRGVLTWPSLEKEGMYRFPTASVSFGDVSLMWYMNQTDKPLVGSRGHLMDSIGLSVSDLDAWVAKLKSENVTFLRQPFKLGDTRAVMIEGPSHEAIELVEMK